MEEGKSSEGVVKVDEVRVAWDAGDPIHVCRYCKAMMWDGERLSKSKGSNIPIFRTYCTSGKVELPFLREAPHILQDLHFDDDEHGRYFHKNICSFNSMFCFTSMASKINHNINNGSAPPTFSLGGQNYHSVGSLLLSPNDIPKFA
ncbi:uncharacterized protein [Arachis hypogaea]|uniref:uncharacterized protein n=1 Tax=Arachis hypogaea TaxID=3818 RepID=UPI003B212192